MQDLSNLAEGSLTYGSMAAGGTVSEPPANGAPGSVSEQTSAAKLGSVSLDMQPKQDTGTPPGRDKSGYTPSPVAWKSAP